MTPKVLAQAALVMFAARQAGPGASLEMMKCICYCIRNRVLAGWHDGDWIAVIENADDSAAHDIDPTGKLDSHDRILQKLTFEIEDVFFGAMSLSSSVGGYDHAQAVGTQKYWCFLNRPIREWFTDHIMKDTQNHPNRASMGTMLFFE